MDVVVVGGGPTGVAAAAAAVEASGGSARVALVDDDPRGPRPVAGRPVAALLREAAAADLGWRAARAALARALVDEAGGATSALDRVRVLRGRAALGARGRVAVLLADDHDGSTAGTATTAGQNGAHRNGTSSNGAFPSPATGPMNLITKPGGADPNDPSAAPLVLRARRVVLATGSVPALPDVSGLVDTRYVTPDTILELPELPQTVAVVGAGRRGVALAQALARFGATVTLVETQARLLPGLDPDAGALLETTLRREGVRLLLGSPVVKVAPTLDGGAWVGTEAGNDVAAELLVVAAGRRADVAGLDLPSAGVAVGKGGAVTVDARLRTTNPAVFAAGPVAGRRHDLSMARAAGSNAVARFRPGRWTSGPQVVSVQTQPSIAAVGIDEEAAVSRRATVAVHELVGPGGLVRVIVSTGRDRRILGATVVTNGAADAAAATLLAMAAGLPPRRLAELAEPGTALATLAAALARPGRPPGSVPADAGPAAEVTG